jgi:hypothetical protein
MLNDNIKLLIEQSGVSDKLLGNIIQVKDEKLDSVTIKTNPKCIYTISKDIILKQCSKCKQFKELKLFDKFGNGSTCLFRLNYRCKQCYKRSKEKEVLYYHKKMLKKNPNYIPLADRPVKVKEVKTKRKYNKKNKIVENSTNKVRQMNEVNLADTNLTEVDFVDKSIVADNAEPVKVLEVYPLDNKVEEEDLTIIEQIVDNIEEAVEPETKIPLKKKRVYKKKVKPLEHDVEVSVPSQTNQNETILSENQALIQNTQSVSDASGPVQKLNKRLVRKKRVKV